MMPYLSININWKILISMDKYRQNLIFIGKYFILINHLWWRIARENNRATYRREEEVLWISKKVYCNLRKFHYFYVLSKASRERKITDGEGYSKERTFTSLPMKTWLNMDWAFPKNRIRLFQIYIGMSFHRK